MRTHQLVRAISQCSIAVAAITISACSSNDNASQGDPTAGKAAATKYGCPSCHGQDLSGSTTPYSGTTAYAANLTPDKDTGLGEWDAPTIKTAILTGKDDEGEQLCATMPKFASMNMTDTEANDVVAYLKSVKAVSKKVPESSCSGGTAGTGSGSAGAAGK